MRALEVFREQHTLVYQIMQFSGCSALNIDRINNVFQQRLGLPWYLLNSWQTYAISHLRITMAENKNRLKC